MARGNMSMKVRRGGGTAGNQQFSSTVKNVITSNFLSKKKTVGTKSVLL